MVECMHASRCVRPCSRQAATMIIERKQKHLCCRCECTKPGSQCTGQNYTVTGPNGWLTETLYKRDPCLLSRKPCVILLQAFQDHFCRKWGRSTTNPSHSKASPTSIVRISPRTFSISSAMRADCEAEAADLLLVPSLLYMAIHDLVSTSAWRSISCVRVQIDDCIAAAAALGGGMAGTSFGCHLEYPSAANHFSCIPTMCLSRFVNLFCKAYQKEC